jgi:hypothetical protein
MTEVLESWVRGMTKTLATSAHSVDRRAALVTFTMIALTAVLWLLIHRYFLFYHDGEIYAFEALAKLEPSLYSDLFLANTSQGQFTVFPAVYAAFIRGFGLHDAALILTMTFTVWSLAATWCFAKHIVSPNEAWLVVAFSVVTVGFYGAYAIFHYSEGFLTARLPAEALIITALVLAWNKRCRAALGIASIALFVHPLMALPGVLMVLCLWLPARLSVLGAVLAVTAALGVSLAAVHLGDLPALLKPMDPAWLEVVRERSQFLFLQLWRPVDWALNLRPCICLALAAMVIGTPDIRKLCGAALLVGATGLAVAAIASYLGCVAILMQGQAWRWMWITQFVAVVLVVPTAIALWREGKCGPLCALLLILEWTCACFDPLVCVTLACAIWIMRARVPDRMLIFVRFTTIALVLIITAWVVGNLYRLLSVDELHIVAGRESGLILRLRSFFGMQVTALACAFVLWRWVTSAKSAWVPAGACAALLGLAIVAAPVALAQSVADGSAAQIEEFADWRAIIPPGKTVLVDEAGGAAAFVWFTLERNNYLTPGQSAGVVFSRETALEVARRSDVLLPIEYPIWKILSSRELRAAGTPLAQDTYHRPLTGRALQEICADPLLGYVISKQDLEFPAVRHTRGRQWKNWNLYDCARVRATTLG